MKFWKKIHSVATEVCSSSIPKITSSKFEIFSMKSNFLVCFRKIRNISWEIFSLMEQNLLLFVRNTPDDLLWKRKSIGFFDVYLFYSRVTFILFCRNFELLEDWNLTQLNQYCVLITSEWCLSDIRWFSSALRLNAESHQSMVYSIRISQWIGHLRDLWMDRAWSSGL